MSAKKERRCSDIPGLCSIRLFLYSVGVNLNLGYIMWLFRSGLVLLAYVGINIYTGIRIFALLKYFFPSVRGLFFWPLYILFCYSFIWMMQVRVTWLRPLRQVGMNSLPVLFYFFLVLIVLDILRLVLRYSGIIPHGGAYSAAGTGIALGIAVIVMVYGAFHARAIHTAHYEITVEKDKGAPPLRIVLVSDLHIGSTVGRKWTARIVDAVNRAGPDVICLAGDIFDGNIDTTPDLEGVGEELRRLSAPLGVFACQGNHDVDRFSFREEGRTDRIYDFLKTVNIDFLLDEVVLVAERFYLAGRKDARPIGSSQGRKTAAELVSGFDASRPIIFLDHQPVDFPAEDKAGADLILSGHTHRGQFFPGNAATKRIYKNLGAVHYGYWRGTSAQGVVSSGAGVWGPPIRIATRSEVVVIDIDFN